MLRISALLFPMLLLLSFAVNAEEATFSYQPPAGKNAKSVTLRGSMNEWGETPMTRQEDGSWSITLDLAPGKYQYKYFIDGNWPQNMQTGNDGQPLDPETDSYANDGYGGKNAVREIGQ